MKPSTSKTLVLVTALLIFSSMFAVGCSSKPRAGWVNTDSMPGHRYDKYVNLSNEKRNTSTVVYLGSEETKTAVNFGPKDPSFDFENLRN